MREQFGSRPLDAENAVRVIARVLGRKISPGQWEDVLGSMPKEIRELYIE